MYPNPHSWINGGAIPMQKNVWSHVWTHFESVIEVWFMESHFLSHFTGVIS